MNNKKTCTEKNIAMLISSSLEDKKLLDDQDKDIVLDMLLQKMSQQEKKALSYPLNIIGISVIWMVIPVLLFLEFKDSIYMLDFMKAAIGLSFFFIPISSIVLIILKLKTNEKKYV